MPPLSYSYVNGAPPKETPLTDARGRITAPWFAYLVGLQKSNSGVVIGAGGLNVNGETISGDATFTGAVLFGGGISFTDEAGARLALGLGSAAVHAATDFDPAGAAAAVSAASLQKASNLSDLANAGTARTNLGLGSAATHAASDFDTAGAAAAAQAAAIAASDPLGSAAAVSAASLQKASNLSDLANAGTARTNLGLGSAALNNTSDFDTAGAATAAVAAIPTAGTATTGLLSAANWNTFNGKQAALGYTPLNPANNLSELTSSAATARTNLGLATVASSGSYNDLSSKPTIPAAQVAANLANATSTGVTGTLPIANGGTGAITAAAALTALGAPGLATANTFTANQSITLASAANGAVAIPFKMNVGADATLGPLDLWMLVFPSATPSARWAGFSVGDGGNMRPLVLNTNGTIYGRVLAGTTTDNGVDMLQVTGSIVASTQVKTAGLVTGLRTVTAADTATTSDHTILGNIAGAVTETLPAAPLTGQEFYLVNIGSAVWTIAGNGKNIWAAGASAASITLAANASAILKYDGVLWRRII